MSRTGFSKIGDYRLGMEAVSNKEVVLIRFLHRKNIYRYFPKRW
jgi:mRNA-degrading endonuclease RelE of RelBE toxin-antitoxin system